MTGYYVDEEYEGEPAQGDGYHIDDPTAPVFRRREDLGPYGRDEVEGRTAWMYVGLLIVIFVGLVVSSRACTTESATPTDLLPTGGESPVEAGDVAVRLTVEVDGDIVSLVGAVPDDGARQQALDAAAASYGAENVIDELEVDAATNFDGGVLTMTGSSVFGDDRPNTLQSAIAADLGLTIGEFSVTEGDASVATVTLTGDLVDGAISFTGTVPDDGSAVDLTAAAEAVYGPGSVDASGLGIGDVTWTEGVVTVSGTTNPGDVRHEALEAEIRDRFGSLVTVDVSGVMVDTSSEALGEVSQAIVDALAEQSIAFGPNSANIEPVSDEVLASIGELLESTPGVPVEIVGHTDDLGPDDENFTLSQLRAEAVVDRLVSLGIERGRFTARGEGETAPIADNGTAAGRAQNRRIEFILGGG